MRYIVLVILFCQSTFALDNWKIFTLDHYSQQVEYWLSPSSPDYNSPLLTSAYQNQRINQLKARYFGTNKNDAAPWNGTYINALFSEHDSIYNAESIYLANFDNAKIANLNKRGYAQNKRLYSTSWINSITQNLNLGQFAKLHYDKTKRAIATDNLAVRILPTNEPFYYSDKIPGEGYPFDNLQNSAIYAGTPLYVVGSSIDKKWLFVISPDIAGWVLSTNVAYVDDGFIKTWQTYANKGLVGIVKNNLSINDNSGSYLFSGYVGTILPLSKTDKSNINVLVAVKNQKQMAEIKFVALKIDSAVLLPISATPANIANILSVMQGRTYGWGNLDMYNDCSSELKNIYALFGIYVPRNTKSIDNAGKMLDLSDKSMKERLSYLMQNSKGLLTFIHISGHVMLYIGKYSKSYHVNSNDVVNTSYPLVYQQVWGLRDSQQSYRSIIGQSVFLPLLSRYPEDKNLIPQSSFSLFHLVDISQEPDHNYKPNLNELLY